MKKKVASSVLCLFLAVNIYAQDVHLNDSSHSAVNSSSSVQKHSSEERAAVSFGVLNGGGSLLGADLEFMLSKRLGFQLGAGFSSFGAGINYHLKDGIRSSMITLSYWHQGIGENYTQSILGPSFVLRAKKLFTCQLGLGYLLEEGPAWPDHLKHSPVMLLYSIGLYLPF